MVLEEGAPSSEVTEGRSLMLKKDMSDVLLEWSMGQDGEGKGAPSGAAPTGKHCVCEDE